MATAFVSLHNPPQLVNPPEKVFFQQPDLQQHLFVPWDLQVPGCLLDSDVIQSDRTLGTHSPLRCDERPQFQGILVFFQERRRVPALSVGIPPPGAQEFFAASPIPYVALTISLNRSMTALFGSSSTSET